jgi:hypothetical protein
MSFVTVVRWIRARAAEDKLSYMTLLLECVYYLKARRPYSSIEEEFNPASRYLHLRVNLAKSSTEVRLKTAHLFHDSNYNLRTARARCDMRTSYGCLNSPLLTNPKGRYLNRRPHQPKSVEPWSVCQLSPFHAMSPVGTPVTTRTSPRYPISSR